MTLITCIFFLYTGITEAECATFVILCFLSSLCAQGDMIVCLRTPLLKATVTSSSVVILFVIQGE